jgi:hypothetical protein
VSVVAGTVQVMTATELIERYFVLAVQPDMEPYFAQFAPAVVVEDDGRTYRGADAIRGWRRSVPDVSYDVREVTDAADGPHLATVEVSGDFPGSPVLLGFLFAFDEAGRIDRLVIAP